MKKLVSLFLALGLCLSLCVPVFAADGLSCSGSVNDSTVNLLSNLQEVEDAFGISPASETTVSDDSGTQIWGTTDYSYNIQIAPGQNSGEATVYFTMDISGNTYPITATGKVRVHEISSDYTLIRGFLSSGITIDGKAYLVDVGLSKLAQQDTISAGITITPEDFGRDEHAEQIFFSFGTSVMTDDFVSQYLEYVSDCQNEASGIVSAAASSGLTFVNSARGSFKSTAIFSGSGTASSIEVYRDSSNKRFIARLGSFVKNIDADDFEKMLFSQAASIQHSSKQSSTPRPMNPHFDGAQFISAGVQNYRIGLKRVGSDTSIASMEGTTVLNENQGDTDVLGTLLEGFISVLGNYGLPITTLMSLMNKARGEVNYSYDGANSYVDVTVDTLGLNFDSANNYFPVGFNILTNGLTGTYTANARLTYYVDAWEGVFLIYTTDATTGRFTVS